MVQLSSCMYTKSIIQSFLRYIGIGPYRKLKWNESGFRPPLCTYRLNWARRTFWGWWDDWDDTVLQTQDSKFEPWRSEAEHATSRSRRLPTILTFTRGWGRNTFVSFEPPRPGTEPWTLAWKAAVLTTTLGPTPRPYRNRVLVWAAMQGGYYVMCDLIVWENTNVLNFYPSAIKAVMYSDHQRRAGGHQFSSY